MSVHVETDPTRERAQQHFGFQQTVSEIVSELVALLQNTLRLLARESQDKVSFIVSNLVKVVIAIGVALMGIGYLLAAINAMLIHLLATEYMPLATARWVVPLTIGVLTALIGWMLYRAGMRRVLNLDVKPTLTVETIEEDRDWLVNKSKGNS